MLGAGVDKPGLERTEGTEVAIDRLRRHAGGPAPGCAGLQDFPEELMMQVTAALVAHRLSDRDWQLTMPLQQQFFDTEAMPFWITLEGAVAPGQTDR